MKKIFNLNLLLILLFSTTILAKNTSQVSNLLEEIQAQTTELERLIEEIGRERIGDIYFQRLKEYQVALLQLKAEPIENKSHVNEINNLYLQVDSILYPENRENNLSKKDFSVTGTGNGVIRGFVRSNLTGEVISNGGVRLYNELGNYQTYSNVDTAGRYLFTNLVSGQYVLVFGNSSYQYIDTAYPNIACPYGLGSGCQLVNMQIISLAVDEILENIDISVLSKPTISGVILDSVDNTIVRYALVRLHDSFGNYSSQASTNSEGEYQLSAPSAGDYYITVNKTSYQKELYNNVICIQSCDFSQGTLIPLSYNQQLLDFDISLQKYATISGSFVDAVSQQAINNSSRVYVTNDSNQVVASANYLLSTNLWEINLPIGNYFVIGESDNYLATKYQGQTCLASNYESCDSINGTLINHTGINTENIVLALEKGAKISGRVTDNNGDPINNVSIIVYYESNHQLTYRYNYIYTNNNGEYQTNPLGNSSYYVVAAIASHTTELYNNITCSSSHACNFNLGTALTINNLMNINNVDFQLRDKSSITGRVVGFNNQPLYDYLVRVRDANFNNREYDYTDRDGNYQIHNISSGTYQLYVKGGVSHYAKSYNNIQCNHNNCNGDSFTPLVLDDTNLNINFQLNPKGKVEFNLISNSPNPITGGYIYVADNQGNHVDSFSYGLYLAQGDYFFYYGGSFSQYFNNFVSKVYGGVNCFSNCDATTGTLVHVSDNTTQTLTLNLDEYFYIEANATPNNALLEIYEQDISQYNTFNMNYRDKFVFTNLDAKLLKVSKSGYFSQLYNGIDCIVDICDISQGALITPQLNTSIAIQFDLTPLTSIAGVITDQNNNPLAGKQVLISRAINPSYFAQYAFTNAQGEYFIDAIPLGDYYLRVNASDTNSSFDNTATTYYGNIACDEVNCLQIAVNSITLNINDHLIGYDIQMVTRGTISGENIKNVFNEIIPITVKTYKLTNGSTNSSYSIDIETGILSSIHLPAGEYKLTVNPQYPNLYTAFPDFDCGQAIEADCANNSTILTVTNGHDTHFNSFTVHQYGIVKGVIKDSVTNNPITNGEISLYQSSQSSPIRTYASEVDGSYKMNLSNGNYRFLFVDSYYSDSKYIRQLYNGVECSGGIGLGCLLTDGQEVTVAHDSLTIIDVLLNSKPKLKVNLIDNATNEIIESGLSVFDINFNSVYSEYSPNLSDIHLIEYLRPGSYYAIATSNGYLPTGYPNITCANRNTPETCDTPLTAFTMISGDNLTEINIRSKLVNGISGYVTDQDTGLPLANIIIDSWSSYGNILGFATTQTNGGFSLQTNVGNYYLSTDTNNAYINRIYKNIECSEAAFLGNCDITQGLMINVPQNNTTPIIIEIELSTTLNHVFSDGFE